MKEKSKNTSAEKNSYAILICARNEETVIGDLLDSIKNQTYPKELIKTFVLADNCTDNTAVTAIRHGAYVYSRTDIKNIGKGYALDTLLKNISRDFPKGFDGYFVFDADNILSRDYIEQMNVTFSAGNDIVTSYRDSKNYGDNWISAGYALWFLRESRYLNNARGLLGASCAVSGTGFLFSRKIENELSGWPFHMLTEDIEFSIDQITKGRKIAFCRKAVLFDEQPIKFSQSWNQRMRWSRGYLQVVNGYGKKMFLGILNGNYSCYDMLMNILPAYFLSAFSAVCNIMASVIGAIEGCNILIAFVSISQFILNMYLALLAMGLITTISEWKMIHTGVFKKILYVFTFPVFMFTYVPISFAALFCNVKWEPIKHTRKACMLHELVLDGQK